MKRIMALLVLTLSVTVMQAQVVTGSYTGNGTSQNITAPGFQPDIVFIKRAGSIGTAQHAQIRIAGMTTTMDVSSTSAGTDRITGFLSNGFSVGAGASVNTSGDVFYYIAIKNKAGEIATGSYTGNGVDNTNISGLSFQPDFVWVMIPGTASVWRTATMPGDNSLPFTSNSIQPNWIQALNTNGFQVGTDAVVNTNGSTYYYIACKNVAGSFKEGSYTGNGTDNRSITGFGFTPTFAVTKTANNGVSGCFKITPSGATTDVSYVTNGSNSVTDCIQQLLADGIEVGTGTRVNTSAATYYWWAFAEAAGDCTWNGTSWTPTTPTATNNAIIASSTSIPASFSCKDLTLNSIMISSNNATVYGDIINNSSGFNGGGGLILAKTGTSTLSGSNFTMVGPVTVNSGCTFNTGGKLILYNGATAQARIANSAGTITGNVTVQRYIPGGRRAFRFLGHPFSSALSMSDLTDDIDITGSGGSPFTTTGSNNPSAFKFDVTTGDNTTTGNNPGWTAYTASSSWATSEAMRVLVRGAKGEGLTSGAYTPSAVTLDMTGAVRQGTQTISLTKGSGTNFVLVGNPFPSQVNMDAVSGTNLGSSFYIWDANQGTRGAYTSYTFGSSSYNLPICGAFVTTLSANGSVVFEEADKTSGTSGAPFKTTGIANQVELKLEDSTTFWDRLLLNFDDNAMATVDYPDAAKLYNPDMTFYTLSKDDSMLSIDTRPYVASEVIKLGLYAGLKKNFKFTAPNVNMPVGTKLYFTDKLLSKTIEVTPAFEYWFTVDTSNASWGNNRFELNTQGVPTNGIANINTSKLKVKLVPNPTTDNVTLYYEGAGKDLNIIVTNMMGVKVAAAKADNANGNVTIPTAQLANGIYNVTIYNGSEVMTQKLIKQ